MKPNAIDRNEEPVVVGKYPSASIRGSGELSGGDYSKLLILGAGEVTGDVRTERVRSFGSGELHGRVEAGSLLVIGSGEIDADLIAGRVKALGVLEVGGNMKAERLSVMGVCEVGGRMHAERLSSYGVLEAGSVETGSFVARGAVEIEGLLSADSVELHLGGSGGHAEEIGGGRIEVWRSNFGKRSPILKALTALLIINIGVAGSRRRFRAVSIEGDDVSLENTWAETVRGTRVRIGRGCRIDEVEYEETLVVHRKALVGKQRKR